MKVGSCVLSGATALSVIPAFHRVRPLLRGALRPGLAQGLVGEALREGGAPAPSCTKKAPKDQRVYCAENFEESTGDVNLRSLKLLEFGARTPGRMQVNSM